MNIDVETIKNVKNNTISMVKLLFSKEYQERVWVKGSGPEVSSYNEIYCILTDFFEIIINNSDQFDFSASTIALMEDFYKKWEKYDEQAPEEEKDIVNDPKWEEIRQIAKKLYHSMNEDLER